MTMMGTICWTDNCSRHFVQSLQMLHGDNAACKCKSIQKESRDKEDMGGVMGVEFRIFLVGCKNRKLLLTKI